MSGLRSRTLAIVGLMLTALFAAALAISARLVVSTDRLSQQRVVGDRARAAASALRHDVSARSRMVHAFANGHADRDAPALLRALNADAVALLVDGATPVTATFGELPRTRVPEPAEGALLKELTWSRADEATQAVVAIEGEPWLVVREPLGLGSRDMLVVADRLDPPWLAHLGELVDGQVSLTTHEGVPPEGYFAAWAPVVLHEGETTPWELALFRRPVGSEALANQLLLLGANLLAVGFGAACIILFVVDRMVLRRIQSFSMAAVRIRGGLDAGVRLPVRSNDELDRLASSINALLDQVDETTGQLRHDALHDPLTGLANRTLLFDRIAVCLGRAARQSSPRVALLFLDLDRLKLINDHLGHAAGDHFIVELSRRLAAGVRPGDTVARLGGDEFALLLQDVSDVAVAAARGEAVLDLVRKPMLFRGTAYNVTASVGLVLATSQHDPAGLVREADMAMYQAKSSGRNRLATYDAQLHGRLAERLAVEQALRNALDTDEVEVVFQPIVTSTAQTLVGFEALARWNNPVLGEIPPTRFITIAEETQLVVAVDRYVLNKSLAALAKLRHGNPQLSVSVNHSARALDAADFVEFVLACLARHDVPPSCLVLEITETQLTRNEERWLPRIEALVQRGVRFALDDFGLGYSSLSRLHKVPVAVLKLDREFVQAMGQGQDAVARAIVGMAQELGRVVIAEGVETQAERARLVALGCPFIQGFLVGHPAALADHLLALGLKPAGAP